MKVFIADDDPIMRKILDAALSSDDYELHYAEDGDQAWKFLAREQTPNIIILDWMMPQMDGLEVCRKAKTHQNGNLTYIIMLTFRDSREDVVEALRAGADDYVLKPFDHEELRARVEVGRRMIEAQTDMGQKEKFRGVLEMAGAVCHELSQPLQAISGYSELLSDSMQKDESAYTYATNIAEQVQRVKAITKKLMRITRYESKEYVPGRTIVDIDKSTQ